MTDTKKQNPKPGKGLQERMQDVYFEFLPPIKENKPEEGKNLQDK
jgi:hypothetical protein